MTKNRLTTLEAWFRGLGLALLGGVGFVLLFHGLDADTPTLSWGWSLLARIAGAGLLYITYKVGKALHEWGLLPTILTDEEESYDD